MLRTPFAAGSAVDAHGLGVVAAGAVAAPRFWFALEVAAPPFDGLPAGFGAGGCESALAFWSVTTMSPLSSVVASSEFFRASAQLWPGRRQEQAALYSFR